MSNGELFATRLIEGFKDSDVLTDALVNLATDGELYGHHHKHGDMTLAYAIYYLESKKLAKMTNYAEFLEKNQPEFEVEIQEKTSWSCSHGVERWRSDCGDNTGRSGWKQTWRKPLREAMDWLRDELALKFEEEAAKYLNDPWSARNSYISVVLDRSMENIERFIGEQKSKELSEEEKKQVIKLLEMQRQAMLMFTSCGWFFDEISGIETVQVMKYASRAMQLAQQVLGLQLEEKFVKFLETAPSNIPEFQNGAKTYNLLVKPTKVDLEKIAAQGTILQLFSNQNPDLENPQRYGCCFTITNKEREKYDAGKFRLVISHSIIQSQITLDEATYACVAIWLGDHNVSCGVKEVTDEELFKNIKNEFLASFNKGEINEIIMLMPKYFEKNTYSLKDVFRDDQVRILASIVQNGVEKATELNEIIFRDNSALLHFMDENGIVPPKSFRTAAEIIINNEIKKLLSSQENNPESLSKLIEDSKTYRIELELDQISLEASKKIVKELEDLLNFPQDIKKVEDLEKLIVTLNELPLKLELWQAQNVAFVIAEKIYNNLKEKEDEFSQAWVLAFSKLCKSIGIRLD